MNGWLTGFGFDLKYAIRGLAKSRMFTLVCVLTLALGFGVDVTLMTLFDWANSPPPAVDTEGLVDVVVTNRGARAEDIGGDLWSYPEFAELKRADTGMDLTAVARGEPTIGAAALDARAGGDVPRVDAMYVSPNYFQTIGVEIARGRPFVAEERDASGEPPVVISHHTWEERLGADPGVLGRSLVLDGILYRVVGVTPEHFGGHRIGGIDVWLPLWEYPFLRDGVGARTDRTANWLRLLGHLHEGTSLVQANGEVGAVMEGLAEAYPEISEFRGGDVVPYSKFGEANEQIIGVGIVVHGLAALILMAICLNVAGMVLVRSAMRERDLALRLALGSGRMRLIRYLMAESGVVAAAGGVIAMLTGFAALRLFEFYTSFPVPTEQYLTAVGVSLALAIVAMLVIGLSPAIKFSRPALLRSLKDDVGGGGRRSGRIHRIATSAQTALAIPILVIIGLLLQATRFSDQGNYGFEPANLFSSRIDLSTARYSLEQVEVFARRLRASVAPLPGVQSVSIADGIPLDYDQNFRRVVAVAGPGNPVLTETTRIGPDFFETIRTPIVRGRTFGSGDRAGSERVVIMTERLAGTLFPGQDALGRRIVFAFDSGAKEMMVVGIAANVAGPSGMSFGTRNIFVPLSQHPTNRIMLVVRAASESPALANAIEDLVVRIDPELERPQAVTSHSLIAQEKRTAWSISLFLGLPTFVLLLLAALGVHGVVTFWVANRTREFGIRMAVGASRLRVLVMVLTDGAKLALPGIVVGALLGSWLGRQIMAGWYAFLGRSALDPAVLAFAAGTALAIVLLASSIGARRAASVEPMKALRRD